MCACDGLDLYAIAAREISAERQDPVRRVDLVVVRENTESLYSGLEHEVVLEWWSRSKIITEKASTRMLNSPSNTRRSTNESSHGRHKANIMKMSDGLFLQVLPQHVGKYPAIKATTRLSTTCACNGGGSDSIRRPASRKSVWRIVSDPAPAWWEDWEWWERQHRRNSAPFSRRFTASAPDSAGTKSRQPDRPAQSALLMLHHLGEHEAADRIFAALLAVLKSRKALTRDLGGTATTTMFTAAIIEELQKA